MPIRHALFVYGPFVLYFETTLENAPWCFFNPQTQQWVYAETLSSLKSLARTQNYVKEPNEFTLSPKPLPVFAGAGTMCVIYGALLVGIRGDDCGHGRGFMSFPGGKLDFGSDTDTAVAGKREFRDEVGLECEIVPQDAFRPELFSTNCFMKQDNVHYVTFYLHAIPKWKVDERPLVFAGTEPRKCAEWRVTTLSDIISFLLQDPKWESVNYSLNQIREQVKKIPEEKIQWMPIPQLLAHRKQLGLFFPTA